MTIEGAEERRGKKLVSKVRASQETGNRYQGGLLRTSFTLNRLQLLMGGLGNTKEDLVRNYASTGCANAFLDRQVHMF